MSDFNVSLLQTFWSVSFLMIFDKENWAYQKCNIRPTYLHAN